MPKKRDRDAEELAAIVGKKTRAAREAKKMTATELAKATGLKLAYISRLEAGGKRGEDAPASAPSLVTMDKVARALDTTIDELVGRKR